MLPDLGSLFNFFSLVHLIAVLMFCSPFIMYGTLFGILWLVKPPFPRLISFATNSEILKILVNMTY